MADLRGVKLQTSEQESEKRGADGGKATAGADVAPLVNLKRKLRKQKAQTILCTGLFLIALFVSAFALLSVPVYFPYEADLFTIKDNGDESITVTFDDRVTDYLCVTDAYHCSEEGVTEEMRTYRLEAWSSLWSKWFSKSGVQSVIIQKEVAEEITVYYSSNDGHEDVCVYGQPVTSGGVITLPRHVLSYYFVLAVVCVAVLFVLWLFARKNPKRKNMIVTVLFYPVSYCIAHVMIAGYRPSTYTSGRDFMFILFTSILIYGAVLLARSIYRERKELKALIGK